jgi:predicted ribosome quality control (RQC) complex YloA/Tae2 family protein
MLERIARLISEAEHAVTIDQLESIEKNNREFFVMTAEAKEPGSAERFRKFEVMGGHEVYAGKNASNNDELTVRFARPNDYWFHARGSSGSHVVLRWNDPKTKPPKDTLRQAASIAAYYSGARGAKMVPVAYTLKKHVRKPRGAAVGAVVMEREEVIMVEPKLPGNGAE